MKPVTRWERWNPPVTNKKTGVTTPGFWSFNHLEDGHADCDKPADPFSRGWSQATWRKEHAHLGGVGQFGAPLVVRSS